MMVAILLTVIGVVLILAGALWMLIGYLAAAASTTGILRRRQAWEISWGLGPIALGVAAIWWGWA